MVTLTLRRKGGAFVTRFYWREAPPAIQLLAPSPPPSLGDPTATLPTVEYTRRALIARDTYLYVEAI